MIPEYMMENQTGLSDDSLSHRVVTIRMPSEGATHWWETQIYVLDCFGNPEAAPVQEWINHNWNDAVQAHAVAFQTCSNLERKGRTWQ